MLNTTPLNRALTALTAPTSNDGVGGTCVHSTQNALKQPLSTLITAHMRCLVVLAVLAQLLAAASVTLADGVPGPSRDLRRTNSAQRRYPEMTGLHPRLEVSILDRAPSTDRYRNLFLLAMRRLQRRPRGDLLSWFSLAQIHGANYKAYNNTYPPGFPEGYSTWGYCTHLVNIFITWHRAYLWHWERALKGAALEVADSFVNPKERRAYRRLAEQLRWPYFDWLHPYVIRSGVPKLLTAERVRVVNPLSRRPWAHMQEVNNPLYSYRLQETLKDVPLPEGEEPDPEFPVLEYPAGTWTNRSETYIEDLLNPDFRADQGQSWRTWLTTTKTWDCMSDFCSVVDADDISIAGLDEMHSTLHTFWGGPDIYPGVMTGIPFATFDPVFPVFHTYFDLLLAIWQRRNPSVWVSSEVYDSIGAFYYPDGSTLDATTPLAPFYAKTGRLMNSNDVRSITSLGYFYMQLPKTPLTVNTAAAAAVAAAAAAGVDASEAAVAAVSDAVEAVAAAANPAAGADDWASTINSMAPVRTYGWVLNLPQFKLKRQNRPVYLMIFWEEPASSAASLATAGAAAAADVAVAAVASTMPRRPASSNAAVQWPAWGLKDEMQGLGVAQLQKHAEFLALSTLTAVGKERTASVAINSAIKKNGLGVSLPSQACSAPSSYPITLSQLRLAAVTATGKDVTSELQRNKVQLLWTCFSDTTQSTKLGVFEETA